MKGRLSFEGLPRKYQEDLKKIISDHERLYRDAVMERMLSAMMLMLSDVFGFGQKRLERAVQAFIEIAHGYSEDAYDGIDEAVRQMEDMNRLMREELARRGIVIRQNQGNIIIKTIKK
jgi:hypothetical protein